MVQPEEEIPETWNTVKYEKPVYPTYSRGKVGGALYCNNKYHCYSVNHSKPYYELTPYRATGFGFSQRSMKYIPLTHVQNRSKLPPIKIVNEKSEMQRIYEKSINEVKLNAKHRHDSQYRKENDKIVNRHLEPCNKTLKLKLHSEIHNLMNKTEEMIGETRYRTYLINRIVRDNHDSMNY